MEVPNEVVHNWLCDLKKKEVNKFERAKLIKLYMKENKLSGRAFAKEFNIPKSTVEDWLLWDKISEDKYDFYTASGINHTEIYRTLRDNKDLDVNELFEEQEKQIEVSEHINESHLDVVLWKFNLKLECYLKSFPPKSKKTLNFINELKEKIQILEDHYSRGGN